MQTLKLRQFLNLKSGILKIWCFLVPQQVGFEKQRKYFTFRLALCSAASSFIGLVFFIVGLIGVISRSEAVSSTVAFYFCSECEEGKSNIRICIPPLHSIVH